MNGPALLKKNEFPNLNLKENNSLTFLLSILSPYCTGLVLVRTP
jgi:hypothetical protein